VPGTRGPAIVATDAQYAADVKANVTAGSVDFLFQQCHGGGFLNDLATAGPASITATAAARWNEAALNDDRIVSAMTLDNYTRAWRDAASARSANGFNDWYMSAVTGTGILGGSVAKDPYAQVAEGIGTEHPIYYTADAAVGGVNDKRTLTHTATGPKQYAILQAWDIPNTRHSLNLSRVYWLLRNVFGVPSDNIIVQNSNATFGSQIPNMNFIDPAVSGPVFQDGDNHRARWLSALTGTRFSTGGTVNGTNIPGAGDKLFIYNTGHGGHMVRGKVVNTAVNVLGAVDGVFDLSADGFTTGILSNTPEASSVMNDDGMVMMQLILSRQINDDAQINLGSIGSFTAGSVLVTSPEDIYLYNGFVRSAWPTYQLFVPGDVLSMHASSLAFSISGLASGFVSNNLVMMASFIGGDQELAYFNVPEPATIGMFILLMGLMPRLPSICRHRITACQLPVES
jgi:hypothetical protein